MIRRTIDSFFRFSALRPGVALVIACLAAVASAVSITRLHADTSLARMFSSDDPAARAMLRVLEDFSSAEELIVLVSLPAGGTGETSLAPTALLEFAQRLERELTPDAELIQSFTYRVDDQTKRFFERVVVPNGIFYLDDDGFAQAQARLTREQMLRQFRQNEALVSAPGPAAQALAKAFLKDPLRLHEFMLSRLTASRPFKTFENSDAFLSPDGRSLLTRIAGTRAPSDMDFAKRLMSRVKAAAERVNTDHLQIDYTGAYAIATTAERGIRSDMIATVTGSVVLLQALFIVAYRRPFRAFVLAFVPVAIGILYGFGAYALFQTSLSPITAVIGAILAGMGIDYSIQYLSNFHESARSGDVRAAAASTSVHVGPAKFGAWFTSVIGFLAIGATDVPALRDFAILGTLGLTGAFLGSVFILPAILVLLGRPDTFEPRFTASSLVGAVARHARFSIICSLIALAASVAYLAANPRNLLSLESDLSVMHPRPNPALDAQKLIAQKFQTSPDSLLVHISAPTAEDLIALNHRVATTLDSEQARAAGITGTFSLATLLPDPALAESRRQATGPAVAQRVVNDFDAAVAQTVFEPAAFKPYVEFLQHLLTRTQPPGLSDLRAYPTLARNILPKSPQRNESLMLVFISRPLESRQTREEVIDTVNGLLRDVPGATLTGLSVLARNTELTIRRQLPRVVLIAIALVAIYLLLHFRSARPALLTLLPTIFGMAVLLAFMRLTHQNLNMINLAALPLLIGIDVDYGIFLVHLGWRENDYTRVQAPTHAIVLCAASMILGFVSLLTSNVPAVQSLGVAMSAGVGASLIGTLFLLLPSLFGHK